MLPDRLLVYRALPPAAGSRERIAPAFLSGRDDVWLGALTEELAALAGQSADAADEIVHGALIPIARRHGAGTKHVKGVWTVERRRWKSRVAATVPPERIREVLFAAKVGRTRDEAFAEAARTLGHAPEALEASLFADRKGARLLVSPGDASSPAELRERYNLALAQALLMRSQRLRVLVRSQIRSVVRYAKLTGLMAVFEEHAEGTVLNLSGPLALFHDTLKYGRLLADLLPALAVTVGWALRAQIAIRGESYELELDATAPLARTHVLPKATDSAVERRLVTDLKRARSGWELVREDAVVRIGRRLFFPDFTLLAPQGRGRVLVEVVGYWEPGYLQRKVEALAAVTKPMVVCVDARHAEGDLAPRDHVMVYRKSRIDVAQLLAMAERALQRHPVGR